jgi:hypothetical protein
VAQILTIEPKYSLAVEIAASRARTSSKAYHQWLSEKIIPAMRLAGIPE